MTSSAASCSSSEKAGNQCSVAAGALHISTIASAVRCYAIDVVFLKYLRAETAQLIDKTMSKRRFEGEDVQAGWDEDPSSDEDSV